MPRIFIQGGSTGDSFSMTEFQLHFENSSSLCWVPRMALAQLIVACEVQVECVFDSKPLFIDQHIEKVDELDKNRKLNLLKTGIKAETLVKHSKFHRAKRQLPDTVSQNLKAFKKSKIDLQIDLSKVKAQNQGVEDQLTKFLQLRGKQAIVPTLRGKNFLNPKITQDRASINANLNDYPDLKLILSRELKILDRSLPENACEVSSETLVLVRTNSLLQGIFSELSRFKEQLKKHYSRCIVIANDEFLVSNRALEHKEADFIMEVWPSLCTNRTASIIINQTIKNKTSLGKSTVTSVSLNLLGRAVFSRVGGMQFLLRPNHAE